MKKTMQGGQIKIVDFKETRVAVLEHRGDPALIGDSVRKFIGWRKQQVGLRPGSSATFNIMYDEFRLDICAATERDVAPNSAGIVTKVIPGGRCAVLRHIGSDDGLAGAIQSIYAEWLPQSGEERRDFPLYCQRVRFFPDVPEHEAITDIFLPLR